jgi:hypothetical protein
MSNKVIQEPKSENENILPKKMTNAEIWQKMLADQKFIREARQQGISFQELREKYGYKFATV